MLRNILLVTWRNLTKNRVYTLINVTGLALGIAAFLLPNGWCVTRISNTGKSMFALPTAWLTLKAALANPTVSLRNE